MTQTSPPLETRTLGLGRFTIDVPVSLESNGYRWTVGHVNLIEQAWPAEETREVARTLYWHDHMRKLKAIPIKRINTRQPTIEVIEPADDSLWYKQSLYYDHGKNIQRLKWDILADMDTHAVWLTLDKRERIKDSMERLLIQTLKAYQPYAADETMRYQPRVFYLAKGAVHLPFDYNERVTAFFSDPAQEMELKISIATNKADGELDLLERMRDMAKELAPEGVAIELLRLRHRTVAGLPGQEALDRTQDTYRNEKRDYIEFTWQYYGVYETPDKPDIEIELSGSPDNLAEKIKMWDQLLNSLRYIGE